MSAVTWGELTFEPRTDLDRAIERMVATYDHHTRALADEYDALARDYAKAAEGVRADATGVDPSASKIARATAREARRDQLADTINQMVNLRPAVAR